MLAAHDQALSRLARETAAGGPFVLGTVEHIVDPVLPSLLAIVREQIGEGPLQLRVDRSQSLAASFAQGEVDAAIVLDPGDVPGVLDFGPLTLRWYTGAAVTHAESCPTRCRWSPTTSPATCATWPWPGCAISASLPRSPRRALI